MRIAFVQHGDYREAYRRLKSGGEENYYAQRYSVDFVERLTERAEFVGVCAMLTAKPYEEALSETLVTAGVPAEPGGPLNEAAIIALLEKWRVNYLVLHTPARRVLAWALQRNIRTLPMFADSWETGGLRARLRAFRLGRLLNKSRVPIVGNHNIPASMSLRRIGVKADKIFPWDWPHEHKPEDFPPKRLPAGPAQILYVGQILEGKGVGDCIDAAARLEADGVPCRWSLLGDGPYRESAEARVRSAGLGHIVELMGRQSHGVAVRASGGATLCVVPSRHDYPEGLPMAIYEALATRTPMIVSDHPMFRMHFRKTPAATMVPQRAPDRIAAAIKEYLSSPERYAAASQATAALWSSIKCDMTWGTLIERWIDSPRRPAQSIVRYSLKARLETARETAA